MKLIWEAITLTLILLCVLFLGTFSGLWLMTLAGVIWAQFQQ